MSDALNALKTAAIDALKADAGVAAFCGPRVYETVPRDSRGDAADVVTPYVFLAGFNWRGKEAGCSPWFGVSLRFHAVSTRFAAGEARSLADAVRFALDRKEIAIAGGHTIDRFIAIAGGDVVGATEPHEVFVEFACELFDATPYPDPA